MIKFKVICVNKKMSLRELKFSNQIQEEQVKSVYHKNFNYIILKDFIFNNNGCLMLMVDLKTSINI